MKNNPKRGCGNHEEPTTALVYKRHPMVFLVALYVKGILSAGRGTREGGSQRVAEREERGGTGPAERGGGDMGGTSHAKKVRGQPISSEEETSSRTTSCKLTNRKKIVLHLSTYTRKRKRLVSQRSQPSIKGNETGSQR